MKSIILIEDDDSLREAIEDTLSLEGLTVNAFKSAEDAIAGIKHLSPAIIISDVNLPGMDGHALLAATQVTHPHVPMLLMTAYGTILHAVSAMQKGAQDYLIKPFAPEILITKIRQYARLETETTDPIAVDPNSQALLDLAKRVADSDASVLITGESGTGKEVLARYIHDNSSRKNEKFLAINCAAIPENMLEATLFGYEKGAFTGAYQTSPGKFEQAQNGTLLLDEISEMSLGLQAKLLRVLQEKELERLGGKKTIPLNVRILATSNRDMAEAVQKGDFRSDLFYRINVFPLHWIPLKDRPQDILPLADYLLKEHTKSRPVTPKLSKAAENLLQDHHWPGNAREMDNVIQRALILQTGDTIEGADICFAVTNDSLTLNTAEPEEKSDIFSGRDLKSAEFSQILSVLSAHPGNRQAAAKTLGISERTLRYKLAQMREAGVEIR